MAANRLLRRQLLFPTASCSFSLFCSTCILLHTFALPSTLPVRAGRLQAVLYLVQFIPNNIEGNKTNGTILGFIPPNKKHLLLGREPEQLGAQSPLDV